MTNRPVVSIGVPTYNRVARLEKSIQFMLAQDYGDVEIVVSDNASTDGTRAFCEGLAQADPRVRYFRQPRNLGAVANYGEVLRLATGEFYMHLGDDDDLETSYVSKCVAALAADPTLASVCGRTILYRNGAFERESITNLLDEAPSKRLLRYYETVNENGGFYGIGRRSLLRGLPPLRQGVIAGDWLYMASVAFSGRIKTIEDTAVLKDMGGDSATTERLARSLGLSPMRGRYWVESILFDVVRDIAWESPVYASLGRAGRVSLATAAVAVIVKRFRGRWQSKRYVRMVLGDIPLPPDVKRRLVALRNELGDR